MKNSIPNIKPPDSSFTNNIFRFFLNDIIYGNVKEEIIEVVDEFTTFRIGPRIIIALDEFYE